MDAHSSGAAAYSTASGRHPGTTLTDAAVRLWPTPRASENENRTARHQPAVLEGHGRALAAEATTWPTPTAIDSVSTTRTNRSESPGAAVRPILSALASSWPTPGAADGDKGPVSFPRGNPSLGQAATQWPTPLAQDQGRSPEAYLAMQQRRTDATRHGVSSLRVAVQMWGTPRVPLNEGRGRPLEDHRSRLEDQAAAWATPMAMDGVKPSAGRRRTADLSHQATLWATPAAKDGSTPAGSRFGSPDLSRQAQEHASSGPPSSTSGRTSRRHLNPRMVEWLMGWPEGWADAGRPLAPISYGSWETASSPWLRRLRSSRWLSVPA
jgi:DNA (cytosine-5)-methyltransferase 1